MSFDSLFHRDVRGPNVGKGWIQAEEDLDRPFQPRLGPTVITGWLEAERDLYKPPRIDWAKKIQDDQKAKKSNETSILPWVMVGGVVVFLMWR